MPQLPELPAGYIAMSEAGVRAIVETAHAPEISAALFHRGGCVPLGSEGRGQVFRFPCGEGHGVLRPYRRGGLPGRVLRDSFLFVNRPLREFRVHAALHARGVPCPAPLGVMWSQHGAAFRGAIATAWVDGVSLQRLLEVGDASLPEALEAAGKAIRALHDAGGLHADLHPANVLVARGQAFLIDFDRARLLAALTPRQRASNLLRLRRAFVKHGFGLLHFDALLAGYGDVPGAGRLQVLLAAAHEAAVKRAGHR